MVGVVALGLASNACNAQQNVKATLLSNAIQLDTHNVKAGAVNLDVTNAADNNMTHELVVLKTDAADGALPVRNGTVLESRFRKMGEVDDVAPGKSKHLTLKLAPGRYVLVCNKPGHYSMGMHTSLLVVQ
jgi:uncharacterized cupredoxin-like copper-binding protein